MVQNIKFTFGSDPEFMILDNKDVISAIGVLKHKDKKFKVKNNYFYHDNVLAECTVKPSKTEKECIENFRESIKELNNLVKPYKIDPVSSHRFKKSQLNNHYAMEISCNPEFCIYKLEEIEPDQDFFLKNSLRTAGGHIHIGTDIIKNIEDTIALIKLLDLFVGIPCTFLDNSKESLQRKKVYGKAGRFRLTKYGIEYRTLSNFWLKSPDLVSLVYNLSFFTVNFIKSNNHNNWWMVKNEKKVCKEYDEKILIQTINNSNVENCIFFINDIIKENLDKNLYKKIKFLYKKKFDFQKEWDLN